MLCPKCKARIGLYQYENRTGCHMAQGFSCSVCGYWEEGGIKAPKSRRKGKK